MAGKASKAKVAEVIPSPVPPVPPSPEVALRDIFGKAVRKDNRNRHAESLATGIDVATPSENIGTEVKAAIADRIILAKVKTIACGTMAEATIAAMMSAGVPKHAAIDAVRMFVHRKDTAYEIAIGITGGGKTPPKVKTRKIMGSMPHPMGNMPHGLLLQSFAKLHAVLILDDKRKPIAMGEALLDAIDRVLNPGD